MYCDIVLNIDTVGGKRMIFSYKTRNRKTCHCNMVTFLIFNNQKKKKSRLWFFLKNKNTNRLLLEMSKKEKKIHVWAREKRLNRGQVAKIAPLSLMKHLLLWLCQTTMRSSFNGQEVSFFSLDFDMAIENIW